MSVGQCLASLIYLLLQYCYLLISAKQAILNTVHILKTMFRKDPISCVDSFTRQERMGT